MVEKNDLIYPDLSYQIIGCAYEVFNAIGGGHKEIVYQKAMGLALKAKGITYSQEHYYPVKFNNVVVGKIFLIFMLMKR